jgi:HK97 family phage major capsid protein
LAATGIVMNINDLEGHQGFARPIHRGRRPVRPADSIRVGVVVGTPVLDAGQFLVGAFADGSQSFDRMGATLMISTENEDDFVRNLATFLVEERCAFTLRRPQAFVYGAFP